MLQLHKAGSSQVANKTFIAGSRTNGAALSKAAPVTPNQQAAAAFLRTTSFRKPSGGYGSKNQSAGESGEQRGTSQPLSELSQSALYHRRINAEFDAAFEIAVKSIIKETLDALIR